MSHLAPAVLGAVLIAAVLLAVAWLLRKRRKDRRPPGLPRDDVTLSDREKQLFDGIAQAYEPAPGRMVRVLAGIRSLGTWLVSDQPLRDKRSGLPSGKPGRLR